MPELNLPMMNPLVVAGGVISVVSAHALQDVGTNADMSVGKTMFINPPAGRASSREK